MEPFKTRRVWIVEIKFEDTGWLPTVGIGLNRDDARARAREWRSHTGYKVRVRQYGYCALK